MKGNQDSILISGGDKIQGEIELQGDKVASVHLLLGCLILDQITRIKNLTFCGDVLSILEWALEYQIADIELLGSNYLEIRPTSISNPDITPISNLRGSICLASALCLKYGTVIFPGKVSGCKFTDRRLDGHFRLIWQFCQLANLENPGIIGSKKATAKKISFDCATTFGPSVGITFHALLASIFFEGELQLTNVALEPVILEMIKLVGHYKVISIRNREIFISSKDNMTVQPHTVQIPNDYSALFTYVGVGMITKGQLLVNLKSEMPSPVETFFHRLNLSYHYRLREKQLEFDCRYFLHPGKIFCDVWPSIPSDIGPVLSASLCKTKGRTVIIDRIYDKRSSHVAGLNRMGYKISSSGNKVFVAGSKPHTGHIEVDAMDIRAGAALLIGSAGRPGLTTITNFNQILRGYASLQEALLSLGMNILEFSLDTNIERLKILFPEPGKPNV